MLDKTLECTACERLELPDSVQHYRSTPIFDESTVPKGLLRDHETKVGVWGRIRVLEGALHYHVSAPFVHHQRVVAGDTLSLHQKRRTQWRPLEPSPSASSSCGTTSCARCRLTIAA